MVKDGKYKTRRQFIQTTGLATLGAVYGCSKEVMKPDGDASDKPPMVDEPSMGNEPSEVDEKPVVADSMTFAEIKAAGIERHGYDEAGIDRANAYLAEFLYMHPTCCNWDLNVAEETVNALDPEAPVEGNTVTGPSPSGGNDATIIQDFLNSHPNKDLVFEGNYKIGSKIKVNSPVRIFGLNATLIGNVDTVYEIKSPDVEFHLSPIDADKRPNAAQGWLVNNGSDNFVLTRSGIKNIFNESGRPCAGVQISGAKNCKIACNEFIDLLKKFDPNDGEVNTSILAVRSGTNVDGVKAPGLFVANNIARNIHSTKSEVKGKTTDPEFFKIQGYDGTDGRTVIIANRCEDAGGRLAKCQSPNVFVASNFWHWKNRTGDLGTRIQKNGVNCQLEASRVRAIHNRFKLEGNGSYGGVFQAAVQRNNYTFTDLHFDYNLIETIDVPPENYYSLGISFKNKDSSSPDSRNKLSNCSGKGNTWYGSGGCNYLFSFEAGFDDDASSLDIDLSGNMTEGPSPLISVFRGSPSTPLPA